MTEMPSTLITFSEAADLLNAPLGIVLVLIREGLLEPVRDVYLDCADVQNFSTTLQRMTHQQTGNAVAVYCQNTEKQFD